jgi:L-ascorbate metabolism protein UlaG (beta-lactamase superfamily)
MANNRYYRGPVSGHFDGTRFFNPDHPDTDRRLRDMLRWRFVEQRAMWPNSVAVTQAIPDARVDGLRVTMVGRATVLIQAAGRNYLVDPVWSERASPYTWAGPRRVTAPGIAFEHLPPVDVVLLTHNHYDHLDIATLERLWRRDRPRVIAPLGNDAVIAGGVPGITVETGDWGDAFDFGGAGVRLHPAQHWSARGLRDRRMALWCGFILETAAGRVSVSGDTGYGDGRIFRDVKALYPSVDLAILPIGAYAPRWFMKDQHTDPDEAVQIMLDCGARQALGVHWGTFQLTDEPRLEPQERLAAALAARGMAAEAFPAMSPGDVWVA